MAATVYEREIGYRVKIRSQTTHNAILSNIDLDSLATVKWPIPLLCLE